MKCAVYYNDKGKEPKLLLYCKGVRGILIDVMFALSDTIDRYLMDEKKSKSKVNPTFGKAS